MTVMSTGDDAEMRRYSSADAAACCEVINAAVTDMDGLNDAARALVRAKNTPEQLDAELRDWHTVVALHGGACMAVGALEGACIKRVYVHPSCHGHGIGDLIMQALENEARDRGHAAVTLEAAPSSVSYYERRGYVATGGQQLTSGDAVFHFTMMRFDL
jgi:predicted N-acetyltransferase YhbS